MLWSLSGCSDTSTLPLQPSSQESASQENGPQLPKPGRSAEQQSDVYILVRPISKGPQFVATTAITAMTAITARTVTPAKGGVVTSGSDESGYTTLTVPPGAVSRSTIILMKVTRKGPVEVWFAPSGLEFNRPASLTFSYRGAVLDGVNEESLRVFFYNNSGWEEVPGSTPDPATKTVRAPLGHFSRYAIGSSG